MFALKFAIFKLVFVNFILISLYTDRSLTFAADILSNVAVDDVGGVDRIFDGIGAISGGGATSKLLMNYEEPHRSNILDYLFKPGFGASLQILKVEIGGDSQSTDGCESSHMHTPDDQNYNRGYEWWLMIEAKKRNPDIKLYGLPWTFPGWVGGGVFNPFIDVVATANYITNWIQGAMKVHNLTIDYIGVWNERGYTTEFVKEFRKTLDDRGFKSVQIVSPDAQDWGILRDLKSDANFSAAVSIIGEHYPGAFSPVEAVNTGKPLWCSEEFSAQNDLAGGGCWARVLTESVVNAKYTGFIAWNLITSYYDGLPYTRSSLMTANQPWSGHYEVKSPIWVSAHHTHYYLPGWYYLKQNHGVGNLTGNGTYIAVTNKERTKLTIVISALDPHNAPCFYYMPKYTIADEQIVNIQLGGSFKSVQLLNVRFTYFDYKGNSSVFFKQLQPIKVVNGSIQLTVHRNELYTLTTLTSEHRDYHNDPPASQPFPVPYKDNFEDYSIGAEPYNLAQQSGSFEIFDTSDPVHGKVVAQVVVTPPVDTCLPDRMPRPVNLLGDYAWADVHVELDYLLESSNFAAHGVFIGSSVDTGGCWTMYAKGFHFWLSLDSMTAWLSGTHNGSLVYAHTTISNVTYDKWFTMALDVQGTSVIASLNGQIIMKTLVPEPPSRHGFVAFGPNNFGRAYFDNLKVLRATRSKYYVEGKSAVNDLEYAIAQGKYKKYGV